MSNTWLNIRFLFWHLQCTFDGKWSFSRNDYLWIYNRGMAWRKPIDICDFNLKRARLFP